MSHLISPTFDVLSYHNPSHIESDFAKRMFTLEKQNQSLEADSFNYSHVMLMASVTLDEVYTNLNL